VIFGIYKAGQGKYTRLCSGIGVAVVIGLGCLRLYNMLEAADLGLWVERMVPAVLFVALSALTLWLINKPTIADFMIAAEGEMKKVNWSSRREVAFSTLIVIIVVVFLALIIGFTDTIFQLFFGWLLG
jgi:preprotein translocase SecE subunit